MDRKLSDSLSPVVNLSHQDLLEVSVEVLNKFGQFFGIYDRVMVSYAMVEFPFNHRQKGGHPPFAEYRMTSQKLNSSPTLVIATTGCSRTIGHG